MATVIRRKRVAAAFKEPGEWDGLLRGIFTLWLKHMRKFRSSPVEVLFTLATPVLWMGFFGVCMTGMVMEANVGMGYLAFITPGVMLLTSLTAAILGGTTLLLERVNGTLKEYLVAPIPRLAVLLGSMTSGLTKAIFQGLAVLLVGCLMDSSLAFRVLPFLASLGVVAIFCLGFVGVASAFASQAKSLESYHSLIMVMNLPALFLSNALYPLDKMPLTLKGLALLNPTTYGVDACRILLFGSKPEVGLGIDLLVLTLFMFGGLYYGYRAFNKVMHKIGA
jgi:ABC-2 type transport system permease protein